MTFVGESVYGSYEPFDRVAHTLSIYLANRYGLLPVAGGIIRLTGSETRVLPVPRLLSWLLESLTFLQVSNEDLFLRIGTFQAKCGPSMLQKTTLVYPSKLL